MVEESGMELEKLLRELRLMAAQPGYRFVLVWGVVLIQIVLRYLAIPIGALIVSHRLGLF
jgi:hypothetical protein